MFVTQEMETNFKDITWLFIFELEKSVDDISLFIALYKYFPF